MFYAFALTIPANTPKASPQSRLVEFPPCLIHHVEVQFPLGCAGLAHTRAFRGAHQVWPTNNDGDLAGNGVIVGWADEYELYDAPYQLRFESWNLDDTYAHTMTWRLAAHPLLGPVPAGAPLPVLSTLEIDT